MYGELGMYDDYGVSRRRKRRLKRRIRRKQRRMARLQRKLRGSQGSGQSSSQGGGGKRRMRRRMRRRMGQQMQQRPGMMRRRGGFKRSGMMRHKEQMEGGGQQAQQFAQHAMQQPMMAQQSPMMAQQFPQQGYEEDDDMMELQYKDQNGQDQMGWYGDGMAYEVVPYSGYGVDLPFIGEADLMGYSVKKAVMAAAGAVVLGVLLSGMHKSKAKKKQAYGMGMALGGLVGWTAGSIVDAKEDEDEVVVTQAGFGDFF